MTRDPRASARPVSVLLISYHFGDAQEVGARRANAIARQLVARGVDVSVICAGNSGSGDTDGSMRVVQLRDPGSLVVRPLSKLFRRLRGASTGPATSSSTVLPATATMRARVRERLFTWLFLVDDRKKWAIAATIRAIALCAARSPDVIVCSGPPMSSLIGAAFVSRVVKRRLLLDFRDPWLAVGGSGGNGRASLAGGIERRIRAWCLRRAANFTGASPGIVQQLRKDAGAAGRSVVLALNGYDEVYALRPPVQGKLKLLYAGTLYLNRNPFPLLEAVDALLANGVFESHKVSVTIVGSFERWTMDEVRRWAVGKPIDAILRLVDSVPKQQLMSMYEDATVLVNIATGQPNQIPAKSFEYLAAGREVLTLTEPESDTSWLMEKSGRGRQVDPRDPVALRHVLTELYRAMTCVGAAPSTVGAPDGLSRQRAIEPMMGAILDDVGRLPPVDAAR
jgi:hypothetical protein